MPDLALEETQRLPMTVRGDPEPTVASRDPGLLDFGDVELGRSGADAFGDARPQGFASAPWPQATPEPEDPLAGLSLGDLGGDVEARRSAPTLPPAVDAPPFAPPPEPTPAPAAAPAKPQAAAPGAPEQDAEAAAEADAEHSRKRLRILGFNALSVVALILVAVVLFQVRRGRQVQVAPADGRAAIAVGVSSAPYVTAIGKTVVVVRGEVRATEALRKVAVRTELLDGGRPIAAGTGVAGAVPTPEEIYSLTDAAGSEALARSVAARAPARVSAGETLPFAAVITDPPANLRGLEVRVSLQPER